MADLTKPKKQVSVWWFAFGYFAVYIPYSFFTKMVSGGLLAKDDPNMAQACLDKAADISVCPLRVNSFEWLPPTILASIIMMLIFISSMKWWKFATQTKNVKIAGHSLPRPRIWTLFSGICTGLVVVTTTLAYTIDGVSIVFAMLLMRGGMLVMSPIVDTIFRRHVRWFSWAALSLSLLALIISNFGPNIFEGATFGEKALMNTMLAIDLVVYLSAYFFRLSFMSKLAKSENADDTKKFFVEEQMVGTPSIFIILFIASLFAPGVVDNPSGLDNMLNGIHAGFTTFWSRPASILVLAVLAGIFSQFNGVFGSLILLDKSENAFAVAVNRCSSILAGVIASLAIAIVFQTELDGKALMPGLYTWISAALIVGALLFLALPKMFATLEKQRKAAEAAAAAPAAAEEAVEAAEEVTESSEETKES
ncbi:MAG: hypothetical protein J6A01_03365 [Proteobacteria bacterium]|nr:hypothetical protein [Pseudomonadota bacterium]